MSSRRDFLQRFRAIAAATTALQLRAKPLGLPIGCQTYPVRNSIGRDFHGTLKLLSDAGFEAIELCSPAGYTEFAPLAKYKPAEIRGILSGLNLKCESCHFSIQELRKDAAARIAWAKELGLTQMLVPNLDGPPHPTISDVQRAASEYNKIAEQSAEAGIQQGLHNEDFEISTVDGSAPTTCCSACWIPSWLNSSFRFQPSPTATMLPRISRSIPTALSPCTSKAG